MMHWRISSMSKFNIFEFKFGKEKKPLKEWIKIGAILHLSLDTISLIPGVEKKKVFNLLDEIQLSLGIDILNDYIIQDTELVSYRIDRVLNKAIEDYKRNEG
jgi:hypothetical protein